jgi:excisionase family DNA binding protein
MVYTMKHNQEMISMLGKNWLTATEAAEIVGCSTGRIRTLCAKGLLAAEKVGPRAWMIERKSAEFVAKNPAKTGRPRKNPKK